ncbi:alpha/beta fold hydrolase [Neisseria sp. Dent CA1/247]|uniref:alpha/beta fold hydrolase n=1 Tax=Neisseria sp. Dent CA1/247 TaxID=2912675 RepID=UPI001FD58492|nr:alpha/beta fold hydrolase [Neisseria sp. Dent CA1/247]UOO76455.1 alpha/beta fold hydrolase [Neisseria sp. Dent CA1/247]
MPHHVLLLHGLYMRAWVMRPFARMMQQQGFSADIFDYRSLRYPVSVHTAALASQVEQYYRVHNEPLHFVGHSLGGLVLRHFAAAYPECVRGRIVTLGTPHRGSFTAEQIKRLGLARFALGASYCHALDGRAPALPDGIELGSLAGSKTVGVGRLLGIQGGHDGTVTIRETCCPGMKDHIVMPTSHTAMLFDRRVTAQAAAFLLQGRFIHTDQNGNAI